MTTTTSPVTVSSAAVSAAWWPKFRGQAQPDDAWIGGRRLADELEGAVVRAVVDEHHLVRAARQRVEDGGEPAVELREHRLLVVERDRDRDARRQNGGLSHGCSLSIFTWSAARARPALLIAMAARVLEILDASMRRRRSPR